jgi:hypothetical protein
MQIPELNKFPTTRYQGSKRKILPWISDCIKDIEFDTVLDAFGGSGMVSYLLKIRRDISHGVIGFCSTGNVIFVFPITFWLIVTFTKSCVGLYILLPDARDWL